MLSFCEHSLIATDLILNPPDEDDYRAVMKEVSILAPKFFDFGVELGIRASVLTEIRRESNLNDKDRLGQVVLMCLNRQYNVEKFGPPTWKKFTEAANAVHPCLETSGRTYNETHKYV